MSTTSRDLGSFRHYFLAIIPVLFLVAIAKWSFDAQIPSEDAYTSGSEQEFSQQTALKHLNEIASKPHFVGTAEHKRVAQYLTKELQALNSEALSVDVQVFEGIGTHYRRSFMAAKTHNILAKISGKEPGNALALVSHYDSSLHSSLGASDAGSGIVTILEGVRAFIATLKAEGTQPKNDIYVIFTDAEERGLLGAKAFVNQHPWAKDIRLALNFEARGSGGPSYLLMETNGGNQKLVEAFASAGLEHPAANSLMYSVYKMLPNDTDLTIFREDGDIQGLNFAFIDDHFDYHTVQDSVARLDRATLNHQAEYLTTLLAYFAEADLSDLHSEQDLVYFNFPGLGMVDYPFSWVLIMTLIATVFFVHASYLGVKKGVITTRGIGQSLMAFFLSLVVAGVFGFIGWQGLQQLFPQYAESPHNFTYNGHWLIASFMALTLALTALIYRKVFSDNIAAVALFASIFAWIDINVLIALYLPGAGFLIVPTLFAIFVYYALIFQKEKQQKISGAMVLILLLSIPAVVMMAPLISSLIIGLGLKALFLGTMLTVLAFSLIVPVFRLGPGLKFVQWLMFSIAIITFIIASLQADYSPERKKPTSINYLLDKDNDTAYWTTSNRRMDSFTQQFFTNPQSGDNWQQETYPAYRSSKVRQFEQTEVQDFVAADIQIIRAEQEDNIYRLALTINPQRDTNLIQLATNHPLVIRAIQVNGQPFGHGDESIDVAFNQGLFFHYTLSQPREQVRLEMVLQTEGNAEPLSLKLFETAYDLQEQFDWIEPRAEHLMPEPFIINDALIIGQSISLD